MSLPIIAKTRFWLLSYALEEARQRYADRRQLLPLIGVPYG